jgi:hypothetical protein
MGAWGVKTFENDSGLDWLADFESEGADTVLEALEAVSEADEDAYIDADDATCALAAAEIVAAIKSGDGSRLSEDARTALANYSDDIDADALQPLAAKAVSRVKSDSELKELWEESDDYDNWVADVEDLIDRLR